MEFVCKPATIFGKKFAAAVQVNAGKHLTSRRHDAPSHGGSFLGRLLCNFMSDFNLVPCVPRRLCDNRSAYLRGPRLAKNMF